MDQCSTQGIPTVDIALLFAPEKFPDLLVGLDAGQRETETPSWRLAVSITSAAKRSREI